MPYEFRYKHRIEFADTDMAGIAHFANYFRFMEMAEHAFLRSLGLSVHAKIDGRTVSWPRVHTECSYKAPLRFEEEVEIHVVVRDKTRNAIVYDFHFLKQNGTTAARGRIKVVCVAIDAETKQMSVIGIPPVIDEKIDQAPTELSKE
jgi:YbgC/YbaW family acyl-CoA thioester hydrolase